MAAHFDWVTGGRGGTSANSLPHVAIYLARVARTSPGATAADCWTLSAAIGCQGSGGGHTWISLSDMLSEVSDRKQRAKNCKTLQNKGIFPAKQSCNCAIVCHLIGQLELQPAVFQSHIYAVECSVRF